MNPVTIGLIGLGVFFLLLVLRVPVAICLAAVSFVGIWCLTPGTLALAKMANVPWATVASYDLTVLPLFIFMANIIVASGLAENMYHLAAKWLGGRAGGLAMATVAGCAGFAAISASSVATAVTMGSVALPEMKRYNYKPSLITGCVVAGGTIGILIPPSSMLIVYGIMTETSIGKLFLAGVIPGILQALFYMVAIYILCRLKPDYGPRGPTTSFREKIAAFKGNVGMVGLVILVLGGLFIGWFTPTEAGAVGAFGAILFSLIRRQLDWAKFKQAIIETMKTAGMIYFIVIGAYLFIPFMALTTLPAMLAEFVASLDVPPMLIMAFVIAVYIILGSVMDAFAMVMLTVPIFLPMVQQFGFDLIWFGIIITRMVEIGMITPPVGLNLFVIAGVAPDVSMGTVYKGVIPFIIADIFHVALLLFVPAIALFLPSLM